MENNQYLERYRRESYILEHNRNATYMNPSVIIGNTDNLKSHLLRIKGNSDGIYFDSHFKETPSTLTILREKQKALEQKWEQHCLDQLKIGNVRPKQMPAEMQEESDKLIARVKVTEEEISWLEQKLQEAQEQQAKSKGSLLEHPRHWGSGSLRHGVLESIGPWCVGMHPEKKVLCIQDDSSPYNGLEIHRFKALVLNPMGMEFAYRHKQEEKAAVAEGRPKKVVKYPDPPSWNPETDVIEYYGISNAVIKKLKQEN